MFKRRNPLSLIRRITELIWPRAGWRRSSAYVGHRLGRLPGTPYRIAAGFACGAAISFTPFMGFHFLFSALLALALRGNLLAAAIGTVVGNPWTFPFIWAWIYTAGCWALGGDATYDLPDQLSLSYIFDHPWQVLWPMTVGGVPTAIIAWFAFYWPVRGLVAEYQRSRRHRIKRKQKKLAQVTEAAGQQISALLNHNGPGEQNGLGRQSPAESQSTIGDQNNIGKRQ